MVNEVKTQALEFAVRHHGGQGSAPGDVVNSARAFLEFLNEGDTPVTASKAGRKAKGEVDGKAVAPESTAAPAATPTATTPAAGPVVSKPVGDKETMKRAVLAYRDATDQATALKLLTDVGAENFGSVKPELYQQVTDAAIAALAAVSKPAAKEADPFGDDDETPAAPALVLADVKKAFVARQKDVSESALLEVLKNLGAVGAGAPGQPLTPSLKHLAADKFAAAIEAVQKLPKTK
jgi:hypothetical protein